MNILSIPTQETVLIDKEGKATDAMQIVLDNLADRLDVAVKLPPYTVATVPDGEKYEGYMIEVTDDVGGTTGAKSDGTNWLRFSDNAPVSV